MRSHCVDGSLVLMMLSAFVSKAVLHSDPPASALTTRRDAARNPSASQVASWHEDLHCSRRMLACILPLLMEREPELHFYIFYEESVKDTFITLSVSHLWEGEVVQAAFAAGATATLVRRESLLTSLRQAVQWTGIIRSVVIVLSPSGNVTALFQDIHEGSTAHLAWRWLVLTKKDVSATLQEILREETQVVLVAQLSSGRHQILASHVNGHSLVRFRKVDHCHTGVGCGCECSIQRPLFASPLEVYRDFNGRQLLVATVDNTPYFSLQWRPDGTVESSQGVDHNVIHAIGHFLNFSIQVVEPKDREWGGAFPNGSVYGMVGLVARRLAHVALNELTITDGREAVVDFTRPYILEGTALISRAPKERDHSGAVFSPFSLPLWTLLIIVTLTMGLLSFLLTLGHSYCTTLVRHHSLCRGGLLLLLSTHWPSRRITLPPRTHKRNEDSLSGLTTRTIDTDSVRKEASEVTHYSVKSLPSYCFNMFRTLVLQGNMLPDDSSPIRVFLFTWYMFGIIMYALYSGSLTSFLTKPFLERPINTLQDLKESSRRGFVPAVQPRTSQAILLKNTKTGIFRELWELMEPGRSFPESGLQAMEKVLTEDIVYASGSLNLEIRASQTGRHKFYISSDTFLPQMYGIACFPGAPFKDKFSIMLDRMVEGGLVARWIKDEIHKLKGGGQDAETGQLEQGKETRSLALDHLQGAFFILAGGCLMSAIFFLAEIMRHQATSV